ncbi:hypothetical protein [Croceicoccus naphthovorans]|uniref:Lipoprotein n=2 Tax=Croceicoccus naphthovorans TaxID=1348774 RepID=A0A0G3XKG1_9SPHN|nr:hypothetical protein [Croceicoccus naphthovorans]AKM10908.1 hypothetical protein AB433_14545 [Croceicoccus naphthovorans]
MRKTLTALSASLIALGLSACSEQTEQDASEMVDRAAADAADNAEVVENEVREATIDVADKVSAELKQDEQTDPDQGDGALDGTD